VLPLDRFVPPERTVNPFDPEALRRELSQEPAPPSPDDELLEEGVPEPPGAAQPEIVAEPEPPPGAWFEETVEPGQPPADATLRDTIQRQLAMNGLGEVRVEIVGDRVVTSGTLPRDRDRQRLALLVRSLAPDLVHEDHAAAPAWDP
jgi:hypothetical protein